MERRPEQLSFPRQPVVLGIAGCSGSGKTTLARELARELGGAVFPLDLYYRDLSGLPLEARSLENFDHPDSLESELFVAHLRELREGRAIERPVYDFALYTRVVGTSETVRPSPFVIVEGILALHYAELWPLYDFSVCVDTPDEICLSRRIYRDVRERGRTEEIVREQYEMTARPMAKEYVLPSQARASITVSGGEALDWSIERVLRGLRDRGLLR